MYPKTLTLKVLESQHPDYAARIPALTTIHDLCVGGWQLERKKAQYLKPRPGEDLELYKLRLEKFTYTNVLGMAISQQVSKLSSGTLTLSGAESEEFWAKFREANSLKGRDENTLLSEMFRTSLRYQHCYLHIEKPYADVQIVNRAQEESLGLNPYVCVYTPLEVINWSEGQSGLEWLKVRQLEPVSDPFKPAHTRATWTFIDGISVAKYSALVKINKAGKIAEIVDAEGNALDSGEDAKISLARSVVNHGMGKLPVVKLELPDDLWLTNQAYLKQLEHLNLDNSQYDTALMSGYVQRVYRPYTVPDADLDHTFVDNEDPIKTGNQYVLKADSFTFSEASGSSVNTVGGLMASIEYSIRDLVGLAGASASQGAVEQSGISKKMDFVIQELVLRAYGQLLCSAYQDLLQLVGKAAGLPEQELESLSVTGLDEFSIDTLEVSIALATQLEPLSGRIPPTALKLFYQQLSNLLIKNASAEQQQEIEAEMDQLMQQQQTMKDLSMQQAVLAVQQAEIAAQSPEPQAE